MNRQRFTRIEGIIKIKHRHGRHLGITATAWEIEAQMQTLLPLIRLGRYQDAIDTAEHAAASLIMLAGDIEQGRVGA